MRNRRGQPRLFVGLSTPQNQGLLLAEQWPCESRRCVDCVGQIQPEPGAAWQRCPCACHTVEALSADGYADGGEPYTNDELEAMREENQSAARVTWEYSEAAQLAREASKLYDDLEAAYMKLPDGAPYEKFSRVIERAGLRVMRRASRVVSLTPNLQL